MTALDRPLDRLRDTLLVHDPGLFRLRSALRGTLTVALSLVGVWRLSIYSGNSMILGFVGVMMAQLGAIAVTDLRIRDQQKTTFFIPFVASLALILGTLLSPWPLLTIFVLFVMTFMAIYVRRFGPRGAGLGLIGYFAYFASIFFKVPVSALGFVVAGIFLAGLLSYVIRFYLIPDRAMSSIEWCLSAYRAGIRQLVRATEQGRSRDRLRKQMARVNGLALLSDDAIVYAGERIPNSGALVRSLQGQVFDLELSARKVFESIGTLSADDLRSSLERLLARMNELRSSQKNLVAEEEVAFAKLDSRATELFSTEVRIGGLHFHTRQAIQATLATTIATVIGTWVSQDRWYWASLTAYVVFAGATRADSLRRAGHRLIGTVFGVIAGMLLATLLAGHRELEIAAVFITLFLGIHSVRAAYSWVTFWFTALVALFYSLMGQLTPEILYLRLEQTLIGALCGSLMAMLVLPVSTRNTLRLELAKLLKILSAILLDVNQLSLPRRERRERVRILERELEALRKVAGPLTGALGGTNRVESRFIVHAGARIVHYARQLIVFFPDQGSEDIGEDVRLEMKLLLAPLAERTEALALKIEQLSDFEQDIAADFSWTEYEQTPDKEAATYSLTRLTQAINALEVRLQEVKK